MLEVSGLSAIRSSQPILRDVSLTVRGGEVLGLIGPNGAGKTTLFECIAGLLPISEGSIRIEGAAATARLRKQKLFCLPDGIRPWPQQTVAWTISLFDRVFRQHPSHSPELLDQLDLRHLLAHRVGTLSKGEAKRLGILLGLISPHPLLMLDEPFDGLDLRQTKRVMALLRSVAGRGRTLFLSIHQLVDAERMCDRFVLLSHGHVVGEGTVPELKGRAATGGGLEEVFLALT